MEKILVEIFDFSELFYIRKTIKYHIEPTELVDQRIKFLLSKITKENIPFSFLKVIDAKEIPNDLILEFKDRAKELLKK